MRTLLVILTLMLAAKPAGANDAPSWEALPEASFIRFTALYDGQEVTGRFTRFSAEIRFDPNRLEQSAVTARIPLDALDTEDYDARENLPEADWFDVAHHPEAVFTSTDFRHLEGNRYEARGTLTLKGIALPLTLPFTLTQMDEKKAAITAKATLSRLAYHIGEGEWADTGLLADAVSVEITLEASGR